LHAKISLKQTVVGLIQLDDWITDFTKLEKSSLDRVMTKNVRRQHTYLVQKLESIVGNKGDRDKRSIEFLGNLWSDIFGNPGPEDWRQNNANILALKQAIELEGKDSAIVHKHIDEHEHEIEKMNANIGKMVDEFIEEKNHINSQIVMMENYLKLMDIANELDRVLAKLTQIKIDGEKGYCSSSALSKNFLQKNLQRFEANLVGLNTIFPYWNWRKYYRYQLCTVTMDSHTIWVTLRIPMVNKAEKMVRVVPMSSLLPLIHEYGRLGISPVLFKGATSELYHLMDMKMMDMCTKLGSLKTCNVRNVVFKVPDLAPLEYVHNKIIFLGRDNASYEAVLLCERIQNVIILSGQVITLPNNCSIKSRSFEIEERMMDETVDRLLSVSENVFSKVNLTKSSATEKVKSKNESKKITNLINITDELEAKLGEIHLDHKSAWGNLSLKFWTLTGIMGSGLITFTICWLVCRYCVCKKASVSNPCIAKDDENVERANSLPSANYSGENIEEKTGDTNSGRWRNNV